MKKLRRFTPVLLPLAGILFLMAFSPKDDHKKKSFEQLWNEVNQLESKRLPKSALGLIDDIWNKAIEEKNDPQAIKALLHQVQFRMEIGDENWDKQFSELEKQCAGFSDVGKSVLHSMLAKLYFNHFSANRWKVMERTNGSAGASLETWDRATYRDTINVHLTQSLNAASKLQKTKLEAFEEVIDIRENDQNERPTLYDFIINQSIELYQNTAELEVTAGEPLFEQNELWDTAQAFADMELSTLQLDSRQGKILQLYQQWIAFRLSDSNNAAALLFANLERLRLVYDLSDSPYRDDLYREALLSLGKTLQHSGLKYWVDITLAQWLSDLSDNSYGKQSKNDTLRIAAKNICVSILKNKGLEKDIYNRCQNLLSKLTESDLTVQTEEILIPNKPFLALFTLKNTQRVQALIYQIPQFLTLENDYRMSMEERYQKYISLGKKVQEHTFSLPETPLLYSIRAEQIIPALPAGRYIIDWAFDEDSRSEHQLHSYSEVSVSELSILKRNLEGSSELYVLNRESGEPMAGVKAQNWNPWPGQRYNKKQRSILETSDKNGWIFFAATKEYENFYLYFSKGSDTLTMRNDVSTYQPSKERPTTRIHIFTDRAIYRPGQTVYFKGIVTTGYYDSIASPEQGMDIRVAFRDANYQEVGVKTFVSNRFGSINGSFSIPMGTLNGQMQIETQWGTESISVEEYKRPTFEVKIDTPATQIMLGAAISMNGKATNYNGLPLNNARVKYKVTRQPVWFWWGYPSGNGKLVAFGTTNTDTKGAFRIDFTATGKMHARLRWYNFVVEAEVTGTNGETQTEQFNLYLGGKPLNVAIEGKTEKERTAKPDWQLSLTNQFDVPVKGSVKIEVSKLTAPAKPQVLRYWTSPDTLLYSSAERDLAFPNTLPVSNLTGELNIDRQLEKFYCEAGSPDFATLLQKQLNTPGIYRVKATASDEFGGTSSTEKEITIFESKQKTAPVKKMEWLPDGQQKLQPGQTALQNISLPGNQKVLYEVVRNGRILERKWIVAGDKIQALSYPVTENLRGGFAMQFTWIANNRHFSRKIEMHVPYTNKMLDVKLETKRDILTPGAKEQWTLTVSGQNTTDNPAELCAVMYDASLDAFVNHNWNLSFLPNLNHYLAWEYNHFGIEQSVFSYNREKYYPIEYKSHSQFRWFGVMNYLGHYGGMRKGMMYSLSAAPGALMIIEYEDAIEEVVMVGSKAESSDKMLRNEGISGTSQQEVIPPAPPTLKANPRSNFAETAFFYPSVMPGDSGKYQLSFTLPESLTRWKFMAIAHNELLDAGNYSIELVAQKELMVEMQAPRFFTMGDTIAIPVKVSNNTNSPLSGTVTFKATDALSGTMIIAPKGETFEKNIKLEVGENQVITFTIIIPENVSALQCEAGASTTNHSDAEQRLIPVRSNVTRVVESIPVWINGADNKIYELDKIAGKPGQKVENVSFELCANPLWYAIKALPSLNYKQTDCNERIFSNYYSSSVATLLINRYPEIAQTIELWKINPEYKSLTSNLQKNSDVKYLSPEQTPWLSDAQRESMQMSEIALLFDANQRNRILLEMELQLMQNQLSNGAWPWFKGMNESRYITLHILEGFARLGKMGNNTNVREEMRQVIQRAFDYCSGEMVKDQQEMLRQKEKYKTEPSITAWHIEYLYVAALLQKQGFSIGNRETENWFMNLAEEQWNKQDKIMQAKIAIRALMEQNNKLAGAIYKSIKEHAITKDEMGTYWKENVSGYGWFQNPVAFQSTMIELFSTAGDDDNMLEGMERWLLKQKQTTSWRTGRETSDAIYALLHSDHFSLNSAVDISVKAGNFELSPAQYKTQSEAGTGYFKKSFTGSDAEAIKSIDINRNGEGMSWGGIYMIYQSPISVLEATGSDLQVSKQLFREVVDNQGVQLESINNKTALKVGDKLVVKLTVQANRHMDFVALSDQRAAALEPGFAASGAEYIGGTYAYKSITDTEMRYFFEHLSPGTFTLEYRLMVTHSGHFTGGQATIQCHYAPEFGGHSKAESVVVD